MENYATFARSFGYDVRFVGIGMGYVTLNGLILSEIMDADAAMKELAMIGVAIMADTLRAAL